MTLFVSIIAIIGMVACGRRIQKLETTLRAIAQFADLNSATVPFEPGEDISLRQTGALRAIRKRANDVLGGVSR